MKRTCIGFPSYGIHCISRTVEFYTIGVAGSGVNDGSLVQ